jgi:pimeloyl-ACP methyl ester carboxylesterase
MKTERTSIKNRHGLKLVIQVDTPDNPKNLVFIESGQGGTIDQIHITAFAEAFLVNNFRTVRFDPTNSVGESGGNVTDVTYDILPEASKLTIPIINIVGEKDQPCPIKHQNIFMDAIASNNKKLIEISAAEHSYRNAQTQQYGKEVQEAKEALSTWLRDNQTK